MFAELQIFDSKVFNGDVTLQVTLHSVRYGINRLLRSIVRLSGNFVQSLLRHQVYNGRLQHMQNAECERVGENIIIVDFAFCLDDILKSVVHNRWNINIS